ncbi:hypothetical protein M728_005605 (plasmid) [Ensifer sp. WSM1721]|uniref:hypothetical protein n=1 Tax=Ensifer sp. WSM1721 TaxID=1041159 RepID=UPI00047940CB|nr:hypothetical protein [Ensifer sp. WSM1721]
MTAVPSNPSGRALREPMIEDMSIRGFTEATRRDWIRCVKALAAFIGRSPDMTTAEDLRRLQSHQTQIGMHPPSINSSVPAAFLLHCDDRPARSLSPHGPHPSAGKLAAGAERRKGGAAFSLQLIVRCPISDSVEDAT